MPVLRRLPHGSGETERATEAEIEDAVHFAKSQVGWSTYINGMQVDYDQFRNEVLRACDHVRKKMKAA